MHDFVGGLHVRGIELRPECLLVVRIEAPLSYVPDDSNDFRHPSQRSQIQALADGILIAEELSRKNIVNDDHMPRVFVILPGEKPAALQRNSHYLQVVFLNHVADGPAHVTLAGRFWLSFQPEELLIVAR